MDGSKLQLSSWVRVVFSQASLTRSCKSFQWNYRKVDNVCIITNMSIYPSTSKKMEKFLTKKKYCTTLQPTLGKARKKFFCAPYHTCIETYIRRGGKVPSTRKMFFLGSYLCQGLKWWVQVWEWGFFTKPSQVTRRVIFSKLVRVSDEKFSVALCSSRSRNLRRIPAATSLFSWRRNSCWSQISMKYPKTARDCKDFQYRTHLQFDLQFWETL